MTDGNATPMYMPVAPAYGSGNGGMFGDGNGAWWLLILLIALGGGWGNGFGGFGGGGNAIPWMNTNNDVQRGFDQSAVISGIGGIQNAVTSGFGDVQTALCGGFAGVNAGISNGFAQAEIAANSRQMASMNQNFSMQSALQNCCCENRAGLADLKYTIATENCADRSAIADGIRDLLAATQAQTQTIIDKMCQQEIDNLKSQNLALQNQVNMQNLMASQTAQTAALVADNTAQTQYIVNRVAPYPIPAYTVPNPFTPGTAATAA